MKLRRNDTDKIIFDMDGVITDEYSYWEAAALTVYELFYNYEYYGVGSIDRQWCHDNIEEIYNIVFCGGRTVRAVKALGVNTNWDLAYVVFCIAKYLAPELTSFERAHFESVCMFIESIELNAPEIYVGVEGLVATVVAAETGEFKRTTGKLWKSLLKIFQQWFHGCEGVPGIKEHERPLLPLEEIKNLLEKLKEDGFRLGIGTGRPEDEIVYPLKMWGLYDYFDKNLFCAYDQVANAEKELKLTQSLAKPHPYVFLKAAFGDEYTDRELLDGIVTAEMTERCLAVGDAPSDLMSAKAGGLKFAAVLTGISGEDGSKYFNENRADMVLSSVLDLYA